MKTSEILRLAADKYLSDGTLVHQGAMYSCNAVIFACKQNGLDAVPYLAFIHSLGCPYWSGFECSGETQGARFLWLDFAALVAEDMGD